MSLTDPVADFLTRIRNAYKARLQKFDGVRISQREHDGVPAHLNLDALRQRNRFSSNS